MKVQQSSSQPGDVSRFGASAGGERGAQLPASPEVFDTSGADDARQRGLAGVNTAPGATLTPPAQGVPRSVTVQDVSGVESVWKRDQNGKPVLTQAYGAMNADGSRANIATEFKLDEAGSPVLIGAHQVPSTPHDSSEDDTQWSVFKRGFNDGATHPAQTIGTIVDMGTHDQSHRGEKAGKQADKILEDAPVVGNALKLMRGLVGEKEADGSPSLAAPDAQPDMEGTIHGTRPALAPSKGLPVWESTVKQSGAQSGSVKETPAIGAGEAGASTPTKPAKPRIDVSSAARAERGESQGDAAQTSGSGTKASSAHEAQFTVPTSYAQKPSGRLQADPDNLGVFRDDKHQTYIKASDQTYPVRFDKDNGTWRAYRPDDPAKPQYPVRTDEHGDWQVHNNVGLKGGGFRQPEQARLANLQFQYQQLTSERQYLVQRRTTLTNQLQQLSPSSHASPDQVSQRAAWTRDLDIVSQQLNNVDNALFRVSQQMQPS